MFSQSVSDIDEFLLSVICLFIFYLQKGAYRDDDGKAVVLECVREAERRIAGNQFM